MPREIETHYYDFIERRLLDFEIREEELIGKISAAVADLHPAPSHTCLCGKPVVFVMHLQRFECSRCGRKWQLTMGITQVL